jgi:hypothetical protein
VIGGMGGGGFQGGNFQGGSAQAAAAAGLPFARNPSVAATGERYNAHNNSLALVEPHLGWIVDRWAVPRLDPVRQCLLRRQRADRSGRRPSC